MSAHLKINIERPFIFCLPRFRSLYSSYQASFFLAGHVHKSFGSYNTHFSSAKIFHSSMAATINAIRVLAYMANTALRF